MMFSNVFIQANGLDKRFNQNMIVKFAHDKRATWDEYLNTFVYLYNISVQGRVYMYCGLYRQ